MNCNLKERALMLFMDKQRGKEYKIIMAFDKFFEYKICPKNIVLQYDIVIFKFDDFEIWGNTCEGKPYFNFHADTYVRYNQIDSLEELGYFIKTYVENKK